MRNETTSPAVATKASRVMREGDRLKALLAAFIDDAQAAAASALTQVEPAGRRYRVEVIGYNVAWTFEQFATPEQAQAWREDGLHVEEVA